MLETFLKSFSKLNYLKTLTTTLKMLVKLMSVYSIGQHHTGPWKGKNVDQPGHQHCDQGQPGVDGGVTRQTDKN